MFSGVDLGPVIGIIIDNIKDNFGVNNFLDDRFVNFVNEKRSTIIKNWSREKKISVISSFFCQVVKSQPSKLDLYDNFNLNDQTLKETIVREQYFKSFKTLDFRNTQDINITMHALIDYEYLAYIQEKYTIPFLGQVEKLIIMQAMHKLYIAIHLIFFNITSIHFMEILTNMHIFPKHFFFQNLVSIKEAINNQIILYISGNGYSKHVRKIVILYKRFVYYLDRVKFLPPQLTGPHDLYTMYYTQWFSACVIPKYIKCFPLYRLTDTFGVNFLGIMLKHIQFDFSQLNKNLGFNLDEMNFPFDDLFDPSKPIWSHLFKQKFVSIEMLIYYFQDLLLDCWFEKTSTDYKYNILSKEEFIIIFEFYEKLILLRCSENKFKIEANYDQLATICHFCNTNKYYYCPVHNKYYSQSKQFNNNILMPNSVPDDSISRDIIKFPSNHIIYVLNTTEHFKPAKLGLKEQLAYYIPFGNLEDKRYYLAINKPLVQNKRAQFENWIIQYKPRGLLAKAVLKTLTEAINLKLEFGKIYFRKNLGKGFFNETSIDLQELIELSTEDNINPTKLERIIAFLLGNIPEFDASEESNVGCDAITSDILKNNLGTGITGNKKLLMQKSINVFHRHLPNMGSQNIHGVVFNQKHATLVLIKDKMVIAGMNFRQFPHENFSEIVYLAVKTEEQCRGHGTIMMNFAKNLYIQNNIKCIIAYADKQAVGYFKKLGFSETIPLEEEAYESHLKAYSGAVLMGTELIPHISYFTSFENNNLLFHIVRNMITGNDLVCNKKFKQNRKKWITGRK